MLVSMIGENALVSAPPISNAINPITGLLGFDSRSVSYGAVGELDLTKHRMMGSTWKLGGGISGKHVKIEYTGENFERRLGNGAEPFA